jgi:hypothetical protein
LADAGVQHVIIPVSPITEPTDVAAFAEVIAAFR